MNHFVHPILKTPLIRKENGWFCAKTNRLFEDKMSFNCFIDKSLTHENDLSVQQFYDNRAEAYDQNLHFTFLTHNENEAKVRESFIQKLNLKADSKVLEIACGTGRDSELIATHLSKSGELALLDISPEMLKICKNKLSTSTTEISYCLASADALPYPDNYFDAVYSFGGLGEFSHIKKSLAEMVRVTKVGGKVVVGDESMPIWLRETYFSKVLSLTNPQFSAEVPLKDIPVEARKLNLSYVIGGVFYLIDFEVGEGEPTGNFDFPIPGLRGGTLRTRYEGQLEGVTKETKEKLQEFCKKNGVSMHDFLEKAINNELRN